MKNKISLTRDEFLEYLLRAETKHSRYGWGSTPITLKNAVLHNIFLEGRYRIHYENSSIKNCTVDRPLSFKNCVLENCKLNGASLDLVKNTQFINCTIARGGFSLFVKSSFESCTLEDLYGTLDLGSCQIANTDFISCRLTKLLLNKTVFKNSFFKSCEFLSRPRTRQKIFIGCDFPSRPSSSKPYRLSDTHK